MTSNRIKPVALNTVIGFTSEDRRNNGGNNLITGTQEQTEWEKIIQKVNAVKAAGFGEVRILIRNGNIYRILVTEEELLKHNRKE